MQPLYTENDFDAFIKALRFAARKHSGQRRKDASKSPYINHPIQVASILWETGEVRDMTTLVAALLHDTVEDTDTSQEELRAHFGPDVADLVQEMTDDKSLPKAERKRLQILNAPHKSERARKIKLADKISNITDIIHTPPSDWSLQRRREYLDWTEQVINNLRGHNPALEAHYDNLLADGRDLLDQEAGSETVQRNG